MLEGGSLFVSGTFVGDVLFTQVKATQFIDRELDDGERVSGSFGTWQTFSLGIHEGDVDFICA